MDFVSRKHGTRSNGRTYEWRAGLLAASIAFSTLPLAPAAAPAQTVVRYAVPAGPLDTALSRFGAASGVQLLYNSSITRGLRSPGVSGSLDTREALGRILAGTGLSHRFTGPNSATITGTSTATGIDAGGSTLLDTIRIEGAGGGQTEGYIASQDIAATKTDTPLIEVPKAVNVVTRDQIEAQGSQTVMEATRYTPGVVGAFGDSDSRNDVQQARGFFVRYNLNGSRLPYGAYSSAFLRIDPYGLERIDVLKGPSSVMYGQSLPGGLINLASKMPTETPLREVAVQGGNHDHMQGMFDFSGPIDPEGRFLYRLTGLARDAGGRVDFGYDQRAFIAPALTWKPTDATSFTIFGHYQQDHTISDYMPLPAAGTLRPNPNGELPANRYAGEPGHDGFDREQYSIGYKFQHAFDSGWSVRQNLQFNSVDIDQRASPFFMLDGTQRYLSRVATQGLAGADTFTVDTSLTGSFSTGPVEHSVLVGLDYLYLDDSYRFASNLYGGSFDLYDPVYGAVPPALIPRFDYNMKRRQTGLYVQDQMRWDNWIMTAGLRHDSVDASSVHSATGTFDVDQTALTGQVGLVYRFDNGFAPYVSYSTSFDPIDNFSTTGEALKPLEGEQFEAGIKYESPDGRMFITASAFHLEQKNITAPNPDPTGSGLLQAGEARVRGLELEAKTELTPALSLIASYAYSDSVITKVNPGTEHLLGKELVMVPEHQASVWLDYRIENGPLAGLGLGGGLRYQGKSFGDAANEFEVGGQVLVDAALSYDFGKLDPDFDGLDLRVNATNLLNKKYVGWCQNALQCYYGQGRKVTATLKYRW
ncbi:TonB-dependent siderophore receptor [Nitratireductor pacificus]|uniref:Iron uptake receptor n=1 Tax=Nitratireductor pacificus pht-3B TaxID=391937 RepID=K2MT52_9HYPH|nr:TonB-dependent siderophore receptor [Nitratireductor pacificus]EKF20532.1 iron uptake receptor [Nitratireductor pacificus pht-3B]